MHESQNSKNVILLIFVINRVLCHVRPIDINDIFSKTYKQVVCSVDFKGKHSKYTKQARRINLGRLSKAMKVAQKPTTSFKKNRTHILSRQSINQHPFLLIENQQEVLRKMYLLQKQLKAQYIHRFHEGSRFF